MSKKGEPKVSKNMADEPNKKLKGKETRAKKRSGQMSDLSEEAGNSKVMAKPAKVAKGAKRHIDFDVSQEVRKESFKQKNNNAAKVVVNSSNKLMNSGNVLDHRTRSKVDKTRKVLQCLKGKVQWTKEFLEKVRKSNEKHNKLKELGSSKEKQVKNRVTEITDGKLNDSDSFLQEVVQVKVHADDGVNTFMENPDNLSEEELDYDDDLSMEDGEPGGSSDNNVSKGSDGDVTDQAVTSTSGQGKHPTDVLNGLSEKELQSNPVIQQMMQEFFKDQFKNLQRTQMTNTTGENTKLIKSPSDTTIYAPAMQQKLTPEGRHDNGAVMVQNVPTGRQLFEMGNGTTLMRAEGESVPSVNGHMYINSNINSVAHFVENIRLEQHPGDSNTNDGGIEDNLAAIGDNRRSSDMAAYIEMPGRINCTDMEENHRVDSDKMNLLNIGSGVSDDDFFHLTCHIEPNLIHKIEKGEFVELEKLLPKDKLGGSKDDNKIGMGTKRWGYLSSAGSKGRKNRKF